MSGSQWGIFDQGGSPVIQGDSVDTFAFQRDARVTTAPQEQGAFLSYNKVAEPYAPKVAYAVQQGRPGFLAALDAAIQSLDLYVVTSPDAVYPNANITHYDYTRTVQQGVTLLIVNVWLEEIRQGSGPQLQNTQSINGTAPTTSNNVQPQPTGPGDSDTSQVVDSSGIVSSRPAVDSGGSVSRVQPPEPAPLAPFAPMPEDSWQPLTIPQQNAIVSNGVNSDSKAALVSPAAPDGSTTVMYFGFGM